MFVITADQVDSRRSTDRVNAAIRTLTEDPGVRLILAPERTAGDEVQLVPADGASALRTLLALSRDEAFSVGLGVGAIDAPLPRSTRAASGPAFVAARDAVTRAKRRPTRVAVSASGPDDASDADIAAADAQALIDLLLALRGRRSTEGWELYDLLRAGGTQQEAAERLGITPQAVSRRAKAAGLRFEEAAVDALVRLLDALGSAGAGVSETG